MQINKLVRIGTVSALVMVLAACGSKGGAKDATDPAMGSSDTSMDSNTGSNGSSAMTSGYDASSNVSGSESANGSATAGMSDKASMLMASDLTTVYYFDFDSSAVKSAESANLDQVAAYLKQDRSVSVVLGGHADERGTREYNMALGERRAKAVENYLLLQGVYRTQLESVSYGEEKPMMEGHEDSSWAKNRRVEVKL